MSVKVKDALLRKRFTDRQISVVYDYLTRNMLKTQSCSDKRTWEAWKQRSF